MDFKLSTHHEIELNCSPREYLERLNEITRTEYGTGKEYNYEGKIDFEAKTFELLQLFDYGNRNYIRPLIKGKIEGQVCNVHFKPEALTKNWMIWTSIVSFIILPPLLLVDPFKIAKDFNLIFKLVLGPLVFLFNWALVRWLHGSKIDDNLKYLTNIANGYW